MTDENQIAEKVRKAVRKDNNYLAYNLPSYDKKKGYEKGYLKVDGETIETPPYSFSEVSDIVKKAFEELYKVKSVEPIGFRGEIFHSDSKSLEIYATGGAGLLEFKVKRKKEGSRVISPRVLPSFSATSHPGTSTRGRPREVSRSSLRLLTLRTSRNSW